jgi:hypothetical protein
MVSNVARDYLSTAQLTCVVNRVNNGAFTAYPVPPKLHEDNSSDRRGLSSDSTASEIVASKQFDLIDTRLFEPTRYSFSVPTEAGSENKLGYWDVYGLAGSLDIAPTDTSDNVYTSYDGGNIVRVSFSDGGDVFMDQTIEDLLPLSGQQVTSAISGRKFLKNTTVTFSLIADGKEVGSTSGQSGSFGSYRRMTRLDTVPAGTTTLVYRIKISGTPGAAVGLSGVSLVLGPTGPRMPFTPSLPDIVVPSGTTILVDGPMCPPGFRETAGSQEALALLTAGQAALTTDSGALFTVGTDTHDHNPESGVDALTKSSNEQHESATKLPTTEQVAVHGPLFGADFNQDDEDQGTFPGAVPVRVLGVEHTHLVRSEMAAVPPTFPLRFCTKI